MVGMSPNLHFFHCFSHVGTYFPTSQIGSASCREMVLASLSSELSQTTILLPYFTHDHGLPSPRDSMFFEKHTCWYQTKYCQVENFDEISSDLASSLWNLSESLFSHLKLLVPHGRDVPKLALFSLFFTCWYLFSDL